MNKSKIVSLLALATAAFAAHGQYLELNITNQFNANIQTYANGANYQVGGSQLNVGSVPFSLGLYNNTPGTTGTIQTPNNGLTNSFTFTVPANTYATSLYTLINTSWGEPGYFEGDVVVKAANGATATLNLVDGSNVRDHNNGMFVNTLSDPTVVSTYFINQVANSTNGQVRLDMQTLVLPSSFNGQTISTITFNGVGYGEPDGSPFLTAMTLQEVPEPATGALMAAGLGVLGLVLRRKTQK